MNHDAAIDVLNELLALEQDALPRRLLEATVFVSRVAIAEHELIRRMSRECEEHCAWLVATIVTLGGEPAPRGGDLRTADLHFQGLHYVLPRLLGWLDRVVAAYAGAAATLAAEPHAARVADQVHARHQKNLEYLRKCSSAMRQAIVTR